MTHLENPVVERNRSLAVMQAEFPMEISVCAWCKPGSGCGGLKPTSHGICLRHLRKMKLALLKALPIRHRARPARAAR